MKQIKLFFIVTILFSSGFTHAQLSQYLTSTTYPNIIIEDGSNYTTGSDNVIVPPELLIQNLPGTNNSGMLPTDMVYISGLDKLYIAGMSGIQAVNTITNSIENSMQYTCGRYSEWDARDKIEINLHEKIIDRQLISLPQFAYNSNTKTICIAGGDRSKIFLMDANFERKRINSGIHWISFPRLDRTANNPVDATDLLETMKEEPGNCIFIHRGQYSEADIQNHIWDWFPVQVDEIFSSKGYKLKTTFTNNPPENNYIDIHGTRVSPTTYMSVSNQHENWLGYFLTYPCHVKDAFRKSWNDIRIIKTQEWSMVRLSPGTPFLTYPQDPYLKDVDMVVVEMFNNAYFQWDQPVIPILDVAVQEPQYFNWQEELDYIPVVVELDPNDPAEEIAVFVNDECQGATVVTGTTNTINAYILDNSSIGDTMEIVTYTSTAKDNKVKKHEGYYVFNPETGESTKTTLTKNNWNYYYLPLKTTTANIHNFSSRRLFLYPNPATNTVICNISLTEPDHISYYIFNSKGQRITDVDMGYLHAGDHSSTIDLTVYDLNPGIYFFHVTGDKTNEVKKIIVR